MTRNHTMSNAMHKVKDGAVEFKDAAYERGTEALEMCAEQTDTFVHNRPYETALIAFGLGAVCGTCLGLFLSRAK